MIKFSPPPSLAGGPPFTVTCEPGPPSNRRPAGPRSPHPDRGARQPTPNTTRPRIRAAAKVTSHFRVSPGSDRDAGAGGLLARGFQGRADPGGHAANLNPRLSTFEEPVLIGDGQLAIGGGGCGASRPEQMYLDPTRTAGPLVRDWARSRTSPSRARSPHSRRRCAAAAAATVLQSERTGTRGPGYRGRGRGRRTAAMQVDSEVAALDAALAEQGWPSTTGKDLIITSEPLSFISCASGGARRLERNGHARQTLPTRAISSLPPRVKCKS
jgi:hypothetical protein